jgi:hypothetical protein
MKYQDFFCLICITLRSQYRTAEQVNRLFYPKYKELHVYALFRYKVVLKFWENNTV